MPNDFMIKIGDKFDTEGHGLVKVKNVFISPSDLERCYEIETCEDIPCSYLVYGVELDHHVEE